MSMQPRLSASALSSWPIDKDQQMSKLSSYSCQGQRQGQIKKVKNNYSLEEWRRFFSCSKQTVSLLIMNVIKAEKIRAITSRRCSAGTFSSKMSFNKKHFSPKQKVLASWPHNSDIMPTFLKLSLVTSLLPHSIAIGNQIKLTVPLYKIRISLRVNIVGNV